MKRLHFTYDMQIEYSIEVSTCNYTIKCIPCDTLRQKINNIKIDLSPKSNYQWGTDGFSNTQIWGANSEPHNSFNFHIEGDAQTGLSEVETDVDEDQLMIFRHPHGLNVAGESIKSFFKDLQINIDSDKSTYDLMLCIMHALYEKYSYVSGSTNVDTSAEEAFSQGKGVCQDYAHIMISLMHLAKIPARYVTGFIIGEGESHAWVEVEMNGKWIGVDPTHDRMVNDDYIKIGHGRDAKDCMINRGIMHGGGQHTQSVQVSVQEM